MSDSTRRAFWRKLRRLLLAVLGEASSTIATTSCLLMEQVVAKETVEAASELVDSRRMLGGNCLA